MLSGHGSLATNLVGESEASESSEAFPRWGNASVPEKPRQDRPRKQELRDIIRFRRKL
jgi:hypothetical protein